MLILFLFSSNFLKVDFVNADINFKALIDQLTKDVLNINIDLSNSGNEINILKENLEKIEKGIDK